ncbi:MAG TPA: gamma-glutamyltransferase [Acidimicrobiales bacterium]|nr:gamma-glutamyltransferase [Acidimicrobiales bacterium]
MIPVQQRAATRGMVATVDHLASGAGIDLLRAGGSAADAAIGASAVLAVTSQHLCGMGGDLFAVVHHGEPQPSALNASGRAGAGASAEVLRNEGHLVMPFRGDVRTATVPGCVDGWIALHERFGRLPLDHVLAAAVALAEGGFAPSPTLRAMRSTMGAVEGGADYACESAVIVRTGIANALRSIAAGGRSAFYEGAFGAGLLELGAGWFEAEDLAAPQAEWVDTLGRTALGHVLWTIPPNSQGYLALAAAAITDQLELPDDPDDPVWPHLLVEASRAAGHDRPTVLHDRADGAVLVSDERVAARAAAIRPEAPAEWPSERWATGGTMSLSVVDAERMAVTLIQSNASGYGCGVVEPSTGIFLHNRGLGFSLVEGHPAELAPGRRPPHTLSPMVVTRHDGSPAMAIGTMGGDSQPQILLQLLVRLLVHGQAPAEAVAAPRFTLVPRDGGSGFETWTSGGVSVKLEGHAPAAWADGLRQRGHHVTEGPAFDHGAGHAHFVTIDGDILHGAADPRSRSGSAAGY